MRWGSSTSRVPENSSSFLTPSATVTLPLGLLGSAAWVLPLVSGRSVLILPKFKSGNGAIVDLVRAIGQAHGAHRGIVARQPCVIGNAAATIGLDRLVDDLQRHVGRRDLDHVDFELRA